MITNDVQHRNTKTWLAKFEDAAANLAERHPADKRTTMQRLQIEISDYEQLRSGEQRTFEASSRAVLPTC